MTAPFTRTGALRAPVAADTASLRLLRVLAAAAAALVLVVIVASAYLRLSAAGLSCADWPACYGRVTNASVTTMATDVARAAHRFAATAVGGLLLALLALTLAMRAQARSPMKLVVAALAVVVGLAALGVATSKLAHAGAPVPAITLANLLGGFALLAILVALPAAARAKRSIQPTLERRGLRVLARVAIAVAALQIVLGAFVSARFAGLACPAFPLCGADAPAGSLATVLDPFAPLVVDASGTIVRPPALAALHWAHRIGAHAVLVVAIALAIGLVRARRTMIAVAVIVPVIAELALGAASVLRDLPLGIVLAHNLVAALLLATLVVVNASLARRGGGTFRRSG